MKYTECLLSDERKVTQKLYGYASGLKSLELMRKKPIYLVQSKNNKINTFPTPTEMFAYCLIIKG